MLRNGEIGLSDAVRSLRRGWWILPLCTFCLGAVGIGATYILPKRFTSETMVLVEQPAIGPDYVKPVVTAELSHRLAAMKEQILSRTRLATIIDKFGLYPNDRRRVDTDDLVDRLRTAVQVRPIQPAPGTETSLPGFYVDVTFDNAKTAQQICTEITSMFLEENGRERRQQTSETSTFLTKHLEEAKKNLAEQDARLAQFKRQYLGSLPEEEQSNLNILTGLNTQLEASTQALSRAQQDKVFNESLLGEQEANWKASHAGQNPETSQQLLETLQDQLTGLQARYTPEHPDVIKLKGQIEELKARMAQNKNSRNGETATATQPPQIQQLRAKLKQDDLSILDLTNRQNQIQNDIRQLQGRIQASPMVEQKLKELTRNYQTAQDFYNDLLKKRQNAGVAGDLESEQQSEQFRVYDPPSLPDRPSFPRKLYFGGGGLGGGLALGLSILYLIAISDKSMHNERDIEVALKLPVLALVPLLEPLSQQESDFAPGQSRLRTIGRGA